MKRTYLDYAATTPLDRAVRRAMEPYFSAKFGNPGSVHAFGQEAMVGIDRAREAVAEAIRAGFREVIFTGSATEANNLALRGVIRRFWLDYFAAHGRTRTPRALPHIVTTAIEHESVLETVRDMERRGAARVTVVPVPRDGIVDSSAVARALTAETMLVSVMCANNEIGTIQPIAEIAKAISDFRDGKSKVQIPNVKSPIRRTQGDPEFIEGSNPKFKIENSVTHYPLPHCYPLFHTDAAQAFSYLDCNVNTLGIDLMTFSAHKIYGPKGVGALYVRRGIDDTGHGTHDKRQSGRTTSRVISSVSSVITGGGQEFGFRSGTENVPAIVGFAKAVEIAIRMRAQEAQRVTTLRDALLHKVKKTIPAVVVQGSERERLPNNLNLRFPGVRAGELLTKLDLAGFAVSAGPACAARASKPSHVLLAIGLSDQESAECIRITLGRPTTSRDIDWFTQILIKCISR